MKFLYRPVTPFKLNQGFAANLPCVENRNDIPLEKRSVVTGIDNNTCPIGYTKLYPILGMPKGHNGVDLQAVRWQGVYNAQDGVVIEVQTEEARGLGVSILTDAKYFCNETGKQEFFVVRYWHLISMNIHLGDKLVVGDLIGLADSTGYSSGDHLHFEVKPVEVVRREGVNIKTLNILQNNGFFGAVDPIQYMDNKFALDAAATIKKLKEKIAWLIDQISNFLRK